MCSLMYAAAAAAKSHQSSLTLCDPIDGSPPGSSVHGILQARVLEWVTIAFPVMYAKCIYYMLLKEIVFVEFKVFSFALVVKC